MPVNNFGKYQVADGNILWNDDVKEEHKIGFAPTASSVTNTFIFEGIIKQ